jgi:hypothetical protein
MGNQANFVKQDEYDIANAVHESEEDYEDDPDNMGFMLLDKVNAHGIPVAPENTTLILDSGSQCYAISTC